MDDRTTVNVDVMKKWKYGCRLQENMYLKICSWTKSYTKEQEGNGVFHAVCLLL